VGQGDGGIGIYGPKVARRCAIASSDGQ
jgi:hypothetical protein